MIDRNNFAGIETGDTLIQTGNFFNKKSRTSSYFAIILKTKSIVFHIEENSLKERWQQIIRTELQHRSTWNGRLTEPREINKVSLQVMNSVIAIIDKTSEPQCIKWWRIADLQEIVKTRTGIILRNRYEGCFHFQPSDANDHKRIFEDLRDLAVSKRANVIIKSTSSVEIIVPEPTIEHRGTIRRSSSVLISDDDLALMYNSSKRTRPSIRGKPTTNGNTTTHLPVPPTEDTPGLVLSRAMSDSNLYYNQIPFPPERQMSECIQAPSNNSINEFYEGEYDYSSPVMNFVYYYLCKRRENSVPNLLQIGGITRRKLGLKLFNVSTPETGSWKDLSSELCGMSVQDTDYFSCLRQQQLCTQGLTETEMILKFWEYRASSFEDEYMNYFKYTCTRSNLVSLLEYLERSDLAELLRRSAVR